MSLKEQLTQLRQQLNQERDQREREGTSGGPSMRPRVIDQIGRHISARGHYVQRNLRLKGTNHY